MKLCRLSKTCVRCFVIIASIFSSSVFAAGGALGPGGAAAVSLGLYSQNPPLVVSGADPFLMLDLSVELTQQGEAYNGSKVVKNGVTLCYGRPLTWNGSNLGDADGVDVCFSSSQEYLGYFDPNKCYVYAVGDKQVWVQQATGPYPVNGQTPASAGSTNPPRFQPSRLAINHECNYGGVITTEFSGNFLNWATMTALDEFRSVMTGGARIIDTAPDNDSGTPRTVLARAYRYANSWSFVPKVISSAASGALAAIDGGNKLFVTNISKVTPWNVTSIRISNGYPSNYTVGGVARNDNAWAAGAQVRFYDQSNNQLKIGSGTSAVTDFNVMVDVCNTTLGISALESNCLISGQYSDSLGHTWYKPEGLLQQNSLKMRYALDSYLAEGTVAQNGGVLRANAKYIGTSMPTSTGGTQTNPNAETNAYGRQLFNPDSISGVTTTTAVNGVKNSGILNYINSFGLPSGGGKYKSYDPVAELYYEGLRYQLNLPRTPSFATAAVTTTSEKDGYPIIGIDGSTTWSNPNFSSCQKNFALYVGDQFPHRPDYLPGGQSLGSDDPICTTECNDAYNYGMDAKKLTDKVGTLENISGLTTSLSNVNRGRNDGYSIAGLAYWANIPSARKTIAQADGLSAATQALIPGQRIKTYFVDTQEYHNPASGYKFGSGSFCASNTSPIGVCNSLWLAAKYGGFEDTNGDGIPQATEWDADNDGQPDTYTFASQPDNLKNGLTQAFSNVLSSSSTASAAAVVANNAYSIGNIYQAIYEPQLTQGGVSVAWSGMVRALFLDDFGQVREDTDGDGKLTSADYVVTYGVDARGTTVANLYDVSGNLKQSNVPIRNLKSVWDASKRLSALGNTAIVTQRTYSASTANGRYIRTWIDTNKNGLVDTGEETDFVASSFPAFTTAQNDSVLDPARLLGLDTSNASKAPNIVNFIRGQEGITGLRNRTIDPGDGGGTRALRLGDVVHSAPLVVGAPALNYDTDFNDLTYAAFKTQYANRRQVVYVGANDGMVHAFNGGFFNPVTKSYSTSDTQPLGGELWAYVPYDLLPHLQWLTSTQYQHMYYVDGAPQSFDVNIFTADSDHPGGWGTILVIGFRLGGGEVTINAERDQVSASDSGNRTLRPAYMVFDITNPENPPKLLAEITDPQLGFTVSQPTVIKHRVGSGISFTANQWYLVMGSGPIGTNASTDQIAHDSAVSYQAARVYAYDLNARQMVYNNSLSGESSSFVGDMAAMDWNKDYTDEVVYFGTVGGTTATATGNLYRMLMPASYSASPNFYSMFTSTPDQPFSAAPFPTFDKYGRPWVYAGTGRFQVFNDVLSTKQMSYYGIREPSDLTVSVSKTSDLVNTTGVQVFTNGNVTDSSGSSPVTLGGQSVSNFQQMVTAIDAKSGWYIDLSSTHARDVDRTLQFDKDTLIFVEYTASGDSCNPSGSSALYGPNLLTGTASAFAAFDTDSGNRARLSVNLGNGQSFLAGVYSPTPAGTTTPISTVITSGQFGNLTSTKGKHASSGAGFSRMSWRELPIQ